jgi:SpoVK/Ycf46/Vps4 family AAA+-type ATPase
MGMSARQITSLLKSHVEGDMQQFYSTALQAAADEARLGHARVAKELRDLIDKGRSNAMAAPLFAGTPTVLAQPRGDLAALLCASYPTSRLSSMITDDAFRARIDRILLEQTQSERLHAHALQPRRKLLLMGPPGSGKTMTASVIAAELKLPLFAIRLEGVITKYLGETAQKLLLLFDAMIDTKGVYLFDEFDALGAKRNSGNDIGEIRRVLNSFLQLLESDRSQSIIVCATNHPELLDRALFRRFDDAIEYRLPDADHIKRLIRARLASFDITHLGWEPVIAVAQGLSQADVVRASDDAAKTAVLSGTTAIRDDMLQDALQERAAAP